MATHKRLDSGLIVPIAKREEMPPFKTMMFICHYESDVDNFKKAVEEKQGVYCGMIKCNSLRNFFEYVCIYQFHEEIYSEVCC